MFPIAVDLKFKKGTIMDVTFQDGLVKRYDMATLFSKYPQLEALRDRKLFTSGKLMGGYGVIWNEDLDIESDTIYEFGETVGHRKIYSVSVANALLKARAKREISQMELASITGIDQADISKIERGLANPSIGTLQRLADGLGAQLAIEFKV